MKTAYRPRRWSTSPRWPVPPRHRTSSMWPGASSSCGPGSNHGLTLGGHSLQEVLLSGHRHRLSPGVHPQFVEDAGDMGLHRARGDDELFGDLLVGEPLRHEMQHRVLAGAEDRGTGLWGRVPGCASLTYPVKQLFDEPDHLTKRGMLSLCQRGLEC